jgi:hypothetical protein
VIHTTPIVSASCNDMRSCFQIARHTLWLVLVMVVVMALVVAVWPCRGRGRVHGRGRSPTSNTGTAPTRAIQSRDQALSPTTCEEYGTPTNTLALAHSAAPTLTKQRRNRQFRKITKSISNVVQNVRDYFETEKARGQIVEIGNVVELRTQPESAFEDCRHWEVQRPRHAGI